MCDGRDVIQSGLPKGWLRQAGADREHYRHSREAGVPHHRRQATQIGAAVRIIDDDHRWHVHRNVYKLVRGQGGPCPRDQSLVRAPRLDNEPGLPDPTRTLHNHHSVRRRIGGRCQGSTRHRDAQRTADSAQFVVAG